MVAMGREWLSVQAAQSPFPCLPSPQGVRGPRQQGGAHPAPAGWGPPPESCDTGVGFPTPRAARWSATCGNSPAARASLGDAAVHRRRGWRPGGRDGSARGWAHPGPSGHAASPRPATRRRGMSRLARPAHSDARPGPGLHRRGILVARPGGACATHHGGSWHMSAFCDL